jgi:hypothetical protein
MTGDQSAFAALVERHRHELHVHCYRMLGSFDEAEDLVQGTLLGAVALSAAGVRFTDRWAPVTPSEGHREFVEGDRDALYRARTRRGAAEQRFHSLIAD